MVELYCRKERSLLSIGVISSPNWQGEACYITYHEQDEFMVKALVSLNCLGRHLKQIPRKGTSYEEVCFVGGTIFKKIIRVPNIEE